MTQSTKESHSGQCMLQDASILLTVAMYFAVGHLMPQPKLLKLLTVSAFHLKLEVCIFLSAVGTKYLYHHL